ARLAVLAPGVALEAPEGVDVRAACEQVVHGGGVGAAELHGEVEGVLALLVGRVAGEGGAQEGELLTDLGELQVGEGAFEGEGVGLAHGALLWASPALVGGECLDEGLAAPLALLVLEVVGDQGAAQVEALALLGGLEGD